MNTVIEIAKEAGIQDAHSRDPHPGVMAQLERFAALVRADEREIQAEAFQQILAATRNVTRADEREACAKVCEAEAEKWKKKDLLGYVAVLVDDAAAAIRARSNT